MRASCIHKYARNIKADRTGLVVSKSQVSNTSAFRVRTSTDLYDAQYKRAVLKVVLETEVDLADVLTRFRIVDVHVDQRDRSALQERFL